MQEILLKIRYFERGLSKTLRDNFIFPSNPVLFNGKTYQQKGSGTSDQSLFHSISIYPFESGKFGKEKKKLQKFEYLKNQNSFLDGIKNIFHSF